MAIKYYKPTTSSRRHTSVIDFSSLDKKQPHKKLIKRIKRSAGRNFSGQITIRHRGGGARKLYRIIDFKRTKYDVPAEVMAIEYDPNRTAFIALLRYPDGDVQYIIAPEGLKKGETVITTRHKAEIKIGNRLPLKFIPLGLNVHDIELMPNAGGTMVRSAGSSAILQGFDDNFAMLKLPSTEIRKIPADCAATIGQVSNVDNQNIRVGRAGRMRNWGIKPSVRGKAMNPVDHPHGGGEGKHPIGLKHPKTLWGKPAFGPKTRAKNKPSTHLIIRRRIKKS